MKGRPLNPEHAANVRAALARRNQSDEMRAKASARATERNKKSAGKPLSAKTKHKLSLIHLGRTFSQETKARMSAAAKIRCQSSTRSAEGKFLPVSREARIQNFAIPEETVIPKAISS
jgi:NUMOD3 motif